VKVRAAGLWPPSALSSFGPEFDSSSGRIRRLHKTHDEIDRWLRRHILSAIFPDHADLQAVRLKYELDLSFPNHRNGVWPLNLLYLRMPSTNAGCNGENQAYAENSSMRRVSMLS
jgi:hypothetical protein